MEKLQRWHWNVKQMTTAYHLNPQKLTEKMGWTLVSRLICWHREFKMAPWLTRSEDDMKYMEQDWQEYLISIINVKMV